MAKRNTKKAYKLSITAEDVRTKEYRKYLYPQEIDGIVFNDDVERKLSESSWFRCLKPEQQLALEKEIRLRAKGEFNHKFYYYEDALTEAAPAIPKAVMLRLCTSIKQSEVLRFFLLLIPYIHIDDGAVRNRKRELFTSLEIGELTESRDYMVKRRLKVLHNKRLIFCFREPLIKQTEPDVYSDIGNLDNYDPFAIQQFSYQHRLLIYVNPFIVFFGQHLDTYVLPYFVNSGWYAVNPYAAQIKDWLEINCK